MHLPSKRIVELVLEERDAAVARGEEPPLYGAKITGGGCGGAFGRGGGDGSARWGSKGGGRVWGGG